MSKYDLGTDQNSIQHKLTELLANMSMYCTLHLHMYLDWNVKQTLSSLVTQYGICQIFGSAEITNKFLSHIFSIAQFEQSNKYVDNIAERYITSSVS